MHSAAVPMSWQSLREQKVKLQGWSCTSCSSSVFEMFRRIFFANGLTSELATSYRDFKVAAFEGLQIRTPTWRGSDLFLAWALRGFVLEVWVKASRASQPLHPNIATVGPQFSGIHVVLQIRIKNDILQ